MLRSALLLIAGLLVGLTFACSLPARAGAQPITVTMCNNGGDPTTFLDNVRFFDSASYHPGRGKRLPKALVSRPPNADALYRGLNDAFCAAPPGFQIVLSNLDSVWINAAACAAWYDCLGGSWGWWRKTSKGHQRIVGLSSSLWSLKYSDYETALTQSILQQSGVNYSNVRPVDNHAVTLLAALAHEIGHIRWYEWGVNSNPRTFCTEGNWTFFLGWSSSTTFQPPGNPTDGYWRDLLNKNGRDKVRGPKGQYPYLHEGKYPYLHVYPPNLNDIDAQPDGSTTQKQLIYQLLIPPPAPATSPPPPPTTSPWASLFAAMSPDEDFVETYKFMLLTDGAGPNLTSATITVPSAGTVNIIDDYLHNRRPDLLKKVGCFPSY